MRPRRVFVRVGRALRRSLYVEGYAPRGGGLRGVVRDFEFKLVASRRELAERDDAREGDAREVCLRGRRYLYRRRGDDRAAVARDSHVGREVYRGAVRPRVVDEGEEVELRGAREAPVNAELNLLRGRAAAARRAPADVKAAERELLLREVWYLDPLRGAARLAAARVARGDLDKVEAGRERRARVVYDAGPLAPGRRGGARHRRDVQARPELARALALVVPNRAEYVHGRGLLCVRAVVERLGRDLHAAREHAARAGHVHETRREHGGERAQG